MALLAKVLYSPPSGSGGGTGSISGTTIKSIKAKPIGEAIIADMWAPITINLISGYQSMDLQTVRGDRMFPYYFYLQVKGTAFVIQNKDVQFAYRKRGNAGETPKVIKGSILPDIGGVCFLPQSSDFTEAGDYVFDIQASKNANRPITFAMGNLKIVQDINNLVL